MAACTFCRIARGELPAVFLREEEELVVFLDIAPIRRGHAQIVPRAHVETFELLDPDLAARILHLGQRLARRQKAVYGAPRVGFAFSGGDVPHAHAHVFPIHAKQDITSARYLREPRTLDLTTEHLRCDADTLRAVKAEIGAF